MRRIVRRLATVSLVCCASVAALGPAASQQRVEPPIARYTMDAGTLSGMAAMSAGGGGGGLGAAMAMMRGEPQVAHELVLRLGSSRAANGDPRAEHLMPEGAGLGRSVPLVTPPRAEGPSEAGVPTGMEMPRGRLLLFWGCGERAGPGQPVVIDFARLTRGEIPPGLFAPAIDLPDEWRVLASNSATYGDWPNARDTQAVRGGASLLGAHRVEANYAPPIQFSLAQDFMPPLDATAGDGARGSVMLRWRDLAEATGYYAWAIGAAGNERDMVWWTSASTQSFGGPFSDWISPAAARRLVAAGSLLAPGTTSCAIPAEVREAAGESMMTSLYAYGPQVDFAYPPRPAAQSEPWRPEWIARVRFRAHAMVMPGMDMGAGEDDLASPEGSEDGAGATPPQPAAKPPCPRGLRGLAERAAGLCQ